MIFHVIKHNVTPLTEQQLIHLTIPNKPINSKQNIIQRTLNNILYPNPTPT